MKNMASRFFLIILVCNIPCHAGLVHNGYINYIPT